MDVKIENAEEYIMAKLALVGEARAKGIGGRTPYANNYALKAVSDLREKGAIRKYDYGDSKAYRVCDPAGVSLIEKIHPDLAEHFSLMVGKEGNRYKGGKEYRKKQRRLYDVAEMCLDENISIDLINISLEEGLIEKSPFLDGNQRDIGELLNEVSGPNFLTSKIIKGITSEFTLHPKAHMYRAIGIFANGNLLYVAYYFEGVGETWWKDVELQLAETIRKKSNIQRDVNSSIFYFKDVDTLAKYCTEPKRRRVFPSYVYNFVYLIPMDQDPGCMTKILLVEDWKDKINSLLIAKRNVRIGDGEMEDGTKVFNLLGCNLITIEKLAPIIRKNNAAIIIHEWMIDIAKTLYGDEIPMMVVESDMLRAILRDIEAKNPATISKL